VKKENADVLSELLPHAKTQASALFIEHKCAIDRANS